MKKLGYLILLLLFTFTLTGCRKDKTANQTDQGKCENCDHCGDCENCEHCKCKSEQTTPTQTIPQTGTNQEIRKQSILTSHVLRKEILNDSGKKIILLAEYYYPQIENVDQLDTVDMINQDISKRAETQFTQVFTEGSTYVKDFYDHQIKENGDLSSLPFVADQMYEVTHNDNYIISVKVTSFTDFGGAHPNTVQSSYTYDIRTGLKLAAEDILDMTNQEVKDLVSQSFYTLVLEQPDAFFEDAKDTLTKQIFDYDFYIQDGNIVFYINPYIIAPYVAGVQEISILLKDNSFFSALDKAE